MMRRTILDDAKTRETQMKQHTEAVAKAIVDDLSGDAIFAQYLSIRNLVHNYSLRNRMLQMWQAPDSALVASKTAFGNMAKARGHTAKIKHTKAQPGKPSKPYEELVYPAAGCKGVWIWAGKPCVTSEKVTDKVTGQITVEPRSFTRFFPACNFQAEDIRYADTNEPFQVPTFVQPIHDPELFTALLAFAAENGIEVAQEGLHGAKGVSKLGSIGLQKGDPFFLQVAPLIHELGHELLHDLHSRETDSKKLKEGEAEAVSAVVLSYLGYDTSASAAYLRDWQVKPEDVLASMDRIAKVATRIAEFIDRHEKARGGHEEGTGHAATAEVAVTPQEALEAA